MDDEFKDPSNKLIEMIRSGEYIAVISEVTELELKNAPAQVKAIRNSLPNQFIEKAELTEEAAQLAKEYLSSGVLGPTMLADAQHIAIATVTQVDHIVSWNFRHIVNVVKIKGFNSVNLIMGYNIIDIRSPMEVIPFD